MDPSDWASTLAVAAVVVTMVASGPLAGGALAPDGTPSLVGDGNATVAAVDVDTASMTIDRGRFGTGVRYLRLGDAQVDLATVTERPRLVYRIEVPALELDITDTRIVTVPGDYRLHLRDRGLDPDAVANASYVATVTVRVQSFEVDRTVYNETVRVEVTG